MRSQIVQEPVILGVRADPEPGYLVTLQEAEGAVSQGDANRVAGLADVDLLTSVISAGQVVGVTDPPYFVLLEKALRDEGTSYHYLPPADFSDIRPSLLSTLEGAFTHTPVPLHRGAFTKDGDTAARRLYERAIAQDPSYFHPFYYTLYVGQACFTMHLFEDAGQFIKRSIAHNPESLPSHFYLAACYGQLGEAALAGDVLAEVRRLSPECSIAWVRTIYRTLSRDGRSTPSFSRTRTTHR